MLHSLYGVALGAAFLIIAVLFDAGARGMAFDADGIIETIATQPLLWLIATVPLVLGLFPWLIGPRPEASQQDHAANEGTVGGEIDRLFDVPGDLLALVGFDGHFKRINPAWQETLGHSMPVVLKTPLIELVDRSGVGVWEGTPQTVAALKQCLEPALDALRAELD